MFSRFLLITEGTIEKVLQFVITLESGDDKNLYFNEQQYNFEHCRRVKTKTNYIKIIF